MTMMPKYTKGEIHFKNGKKDYIVWYYIVNPEAIMFSNYCGRYNFSYKNGTFYERISVMDNYGNCQTDIFPASDIDHIVINGVTYRNTI